MNRISYADAVRTLRDAESVLITTHAGPDGDAIGSALGVYHLLRAMGKERVTLASHDPVPRMYRWLHGADRFVLPPDITGEYALGVIVDVAQFDRCGDVEPHLRNCAEVLVLDHHLEENPCGDMHVIETGFASASEVIFELYWEAGVELTREAAECLYVGLATDTGGFRHSNTNADAHRRASVLLEAGVDAHDVSNRVFETYSKAKLALLEKTLERLTVTAEGRVAHTYLTQRDMNETHAAQEDIEGLVNFARNLEGVEVGILFREVEDGKKIKVSVRSGDGFNAAACLQPLGGGGHKGAAGLTLEKPLDIAKEEVLHAVHEKLTGDGR